MRCAESQAEAAWKQLTLHGNRCFERGELAAACNAYEQARALALARFGDWTQADDAVAAIVVSYLNLSEAQARLGELAEAGQSLCAVHASLLQARDDADLPESLRAAAGGHLRKTVAAMLRFQATHGERPEVARALHAACQVPCATLAWGRPQTLH